MNGRDFNLLSADLRNYKLAFKDAIARNDLEEVRKLSIMYVRLSDRFYEFMSNSDVTTLDIVWNLRGRELIELAMTFSKSQEMLYEWLQTIVKAVAASV